jgi:hypothetical protein
MNYLVEIRTPGGKSQLFTLRATPKKKIGVLARRLAWMLRTDFPSKWEGAREYYIMPVDHD